MGKALLKILLISILWLPFSILYAAGPVKILLVPGHDDTIWGAQYGNIKEADMNLRLATELLNILKKDKRFEVHITRDSGGYTKEFSDYFVNHQSDIIAFRDNAKLATKENLSNGNFVEREGVPHNVAPGNMSVILYGINKWANENKMDTVIHIHFNDYPRDTKWTAGIYKGFAIYIPDDQMLNAFGSKNLAQNIFKELKKKYTTSTYPKEEGGLITDQSLIALGSNSTLVTDTRSVLIEYGYIYRFANSIFRHKTYTNMANLTATGIKNYFFP